MVTTVASHYKNHLAPIYVWMAGGVEHAAALGASDLAEFLGTPGYAVDLGAGFGMHTIPLARSGHRVLAIDTCSELLYVLRGQCAGAQVEAIEADLQDFVLHLSGKADLILCMGDTLTHLDSTTQVERLLRNVAGSLRPGGRFVATFRDYLNLPKGIDRFIPVRSDADRIHTCFLEEAPEHVVVHDLIHERRAEGWSTRVSSYEKLRLSPDTVVQAAESVGLRCRIDAGARGMVKLHAVA